MPAILLGLAFQSAPEMLQHMFEEGLARRERDYGVLDPRTAAAARGLGMYLQQSGDRTGAYQALSKALAIDEKLQCQSCHNPEDAADLASVAGPRDAEGLWRRASASPDAAIGARSFTALGEIRNAANDRAPCSVTG